MAAVPGSFDDQHCGDFYVCDGWKVDRGTLTLVWQLEVEEEDPGVVFAVLQRDGEFARVYESGPTITGDPRGLDLPVSVDEMVEIVEDPRFGLTTTTDAVAAGDHLPAPKWG